MKKYATPANWMKYIFFAIGGLPYAAVRDLILYRNCMGTIGKARGFVEGLFEKKSTAEGMLAQNAGGNHK
jgi:hypothetical protein